MNRSIAPHPTGGALAGTPSSFPTPQLQAVMPCHMAPYSSAPRGAHPPLMNQCTPQQLFHYPNNCTTSHTPQCPPPIANTQFPPSNAGKTPSQTVTHQQSKDPLYYMKFNPNGVYCGICLTGFAAKQWRHHFNKHHPNLVFSKQANKFICKLNTYVQSTLNDPQRWVYANSSSLHVQPYCTSCNQVFSTKKSSSKHYKRNKCNARSHAKYTPCYRLKCGSFFPVTGNLASPGILLQNEEDHFHPTCSEPIVHQSTKPRTQQNQPVAVNNALALTPPAGDKFINYFGQLPVNNCNMTIKVDAVLDSIVGPHDVTTDWRKIFHKRIAMDEDFVATIKEDLQLFSNSAQIISEDVSLSKTTDAFALLEQNFLSIAYGQPGNVRAELVKFRLDELGGVDNQSRWAFRPRKEDSKDQMNEFKQLICYLSIHKCPIIEPYLIQLAHPRYDAAQAHRDTMVCRLIYELAVEPVPNGDYIPWLCRFAQSRCFHSKSGSIQMRSPNKCGSLFATVLYIIREGVLGCAASMEHAGQSGKVSEMIAHVQKSPVTNIIAPWLSLCRAKDAAMAKENPSEYNHLGDIICKNAIFQKKHYTRLIPMIAGALINVFGQIYVGDAWRGYLSTQDIKVITNVYHLISKMLTQLSNFPLSTLLFFRLEKIGLVGMCQFTIRTKSP